MSKQIEVCIKIVLDEYPEPLQDVLADMDFAVSNAVGNGMLTSSCPEVTLEDWKVTVQENFNK